MSRRNLFRNNKSSPNNRRSTRSSNVIPGDGIYDGCDVYNSTMFGVNVHNCNLDNCCKVITEKDTSGWCAYGWCRGAHWQGKPPEQSIHAIDVTKEDSTDFTNIAWSKRPPTRFIKYDKSYYQECTTPRDCIEGIYQLCVSNGNCDEEGCTDPNACNYSPTVQTDDGSCSYPPEGFDCDGNELPCEQQDLITCPDGSCAITFNDCADYCEPCTYCPDEASITWETEEQCLERCSQFGEDCSCEIDWCSCKYCIGCLEADSCNYVGNPDLDCDGCCEYSFQFWPDGGNKCVPIRYYRPCNGNTCHPSCYSCSGGTIPGISPTDCCWYPENDFGELLPCCTCNQQYNDCGKCVDFEEPCDCCGNPDGNATIDGTAYACTVNELCILTENSPYHLVTIDGCTDESFYCQSIDDYNANEVIAIPGGCYNPYSTDCINNQYPDNCPTGYGVEDCCSACSSGIPTVTLPPACPNISPACLGVQCSDINC